ncbi:hypothetical protein BJX62DRAFT_214557, partial [Aspergillus germanicus]
MADAKFHLFPHLPAELRLQIWHDALPATLSTRSAVFPYKKGCWGPRHLTPGDPEYDSLHEDLNLNFEFDHTLLDPLEISLPLFQVNHEAHSVALQWIQTQNLTTRFDKQKNELVFLRPFNADTDTLYVSRGQWNDFICEPLERPFEEDLVERHLGCPGPAFSRLAIDDWLLCRDTNCLAEMFEYYYTIVTVFIIVEFRSEDGVGGESKSEAEAEAVTGNPAQWRQIESSNVLGPTFYWDEESGSFLWKDILEGTEVTDYPLWKILNYIGQKLPGVIAGWRHRDFEVRPACLLTRSNYVASG